jgi:hypothetical protein
MRFTFVILLFLNLGADAQMIIKAHANYRPYAVAAAQNLLLDDYPNAAAAYSLRKLDNNYTGSAIRVRRSNDNSEQDIGFVGNDLDTASLKTFVGANSGFVTTWYDQSGNARNATQSTASRQPRIVNTGTIERDNDNNKLGLRFNQASNNGLEHVFNFTITSQSVFAVFNMLSTSGNYARVFTQSPSGDDFASDNYIPIIRNLTNNNVGSWIDGIKSGININYSIQYIYASIHSGTQLINYLNSTTSSSAYNHALNRNETRLAIGNVTSTTNGTGAFDGHITEIIVYNSNQSSNRTGIETNINSYYGIY